MGSRTVGSKLWRESSTLIILGKNGSKSLDNTGFNYKVLALQRHQKSSFMPNGIVFPGGVTEKSDDSADWLKLYKNFGVDDFKFREITNIEGERPLIFQKQPDSVLEKEISLRIGAIRETFEELGILICKNRQQLNEWQPYSNVTENFEIAKWQKEVHKDPHKFLHLCMELNVVPDLWSIYEWSAWLTPILFIRPKRFLTSFFLLALPNQPKLHAEINEVQEGMWKSPDEYFNMNLENNTWIPPPQFYELSRINQIKDFDTLVRFSKERNTKGTTLFYPISYTTSDALIGVYPGDDFYPENPDLENVTHNVEEYKNITSDQFRNMAKNIHRSEHYSKNGMNIFTNINSLNGHLIPTHNLMRSKL